MECFLTKGELIRLDGGKDGLLLRCATGTVWLTRGDGADYLIYAGKSFKLSPRQVATVEALQAVKFYLDDAQATSDMLHKPIIGFAAC